MPERKGKKIENFFVGLYKKFISFDDLFRRQHPCWSTLKIFIKSASLSSPFQFLHKPNQLSNLFFSAFDSESLFSLVCGVALGGVHKLRLQEEVGRQSRNVLFLSKFIRQKMSTQGCRWLKKAKNLSTQFVNAPLCWWS